MKMTFLELISLIYVERIVGLLNYATRCTAFAKMTTVVKENLGVSMHIVMKT